MLVLQAPVTQSTCPCWVLVAFTFACTIGAYKQNIVTNGGVMVDFFPSYLVFWCVGMIFCWEKVNKKSLTSAYY